MNTPAGNTLRKKKLPLRYAGVIMPLIVSILMSGLVSMVSTLRALGFVPGIVGIWLNTWLLAWVVAFPSLLVILPLSRKITGLFVDLRQNT